MRDRLSGSWLPVVVLNPTERLALFGVAPPGRILFSISMEKGETDMTAWGSADLEDYYFSLCGFLKYTSSFKYS